MAMNTKEETPASGENDAMMVCGKGHRFRSRFVHAPPAERCFCGEGARPAHGGPIRDEFPIEEPPDRAVELEQQHTRIRELESKRLAAEEAAKSAGDETPSIGSEE